ncbi:MAG: toxic anion resistance protein [Peptococcaceae bacterium]|nr:toxic anion resistance protein [Peptococcaceae bacterium]
MAFQMEVANTEVLKKEIVEESAPLSEEVAQLQRQAEQNVREVMTLDLEAMEQKRSILKSIDGFGIDNMQSSARRNTLLQTTVGSLSKAGGEGSVVSKSLGDLHREIKDLDPSALDFTKSGVLGKIFNPIRNYFAKYEKADSVIKDIIVSLDKGKDTLKNDNTTLEIEEDNLRELTKKLRKEIELGSMMDQVVERAITEEKAKADGDEEKIRFVTEEVLFPLRQRVMDMQQMIVVNQQGIVAMEVIRRNNKELIRGVDRAKTVTVTALRTAVMVASALYNQKIVLKKIDALNEATNTMITATSQMLKEQGTAVQRQATETNISPDVLKTAFNDAIAALDAISTFKQQALPKMAETVSQFREMAEQGEKEIARLEKGSAFNS